METNINELYQMKNKNVLVRIANNVTLANGIAVTETRGKRDIVCGVIELAEPSTKLAIKSLCWYPMFAGLPITIDGISNGSGSYYIVQAEDILMVEKGEN